MRPANLKTKIFLDGGNPQETKEAITLLEFLDGQTTNPTLISKNPVVAERLAQGKKFSLEEAFEFYKKVVSEISDLIPEAAVSIEVPADKNTTSEQMLNIGREMFSWIPNAYIKFPISTEGLEAAELAVKEGIRVNMTLCFTQEQAAAVYSVTKTGDAFVSPFVGRLDDKGENGMDLIKNIIQMFVGSDHHVKVLTASVRNIDHFLMALTLGSDIITAPFKILKEWVEKGSPIPANNYSHDSGNLKSIPYQQLDLDKNWREFNIHHELTDKGIEKFASDWNSLII
ncbi:transaldolase [Candidatus Daviesbacteria bacterium]|nr:transaldolase [Candidatus Daviesbacteria bacterium]